MIVIYNDSNGVTTSKHFLILKKHQINIQVFSRIFSPHMNTGRKAAPEH